MSAIGFFPTPYPNEDFRSVIYRCHVRSTHTEFNETKNELFRLKSYKNSVLPRNLQHLLERFSKHSVLTVDYILNRHTMFVLYRPFLNKKRVVKIMDDIIGGRDSQSSNANRLAGIGSPRLYSETPKYCPQCLRVDEETYGEAYLHLEHQYDFLHLCPTHNVGLITNCPTCEVPLSKPYAESITVTTKCRNGHELLLNSKLKKSSEIMYFEKEFLREIEEFRNACHELNQEELLVKYMSLLGNKGYINHITGDVKKSKLLEDVMKHYSIDKLSALGVTEKYLRSRQTSLFLFDKDKFQNHVLLHCLILWYLLESIKDIVKYDVSYLIEIPFNRGPWPCYSPVCPSWNTRQKPIECCERKLSNGFITARFRCPGCGYTYAKRWMIGATDNWERDRTVIYMGDLFVTKVIELLSYGYSYLDISRRLKVQTVIVKKYIKKINDSMKNDEIAAAGSEIHTSEAEFEVPNILNYETAIENRKADKIAQYRKEIMELIALGLGRTKVQRANEKAVIYLRNYDNEWLMENLPPIQGTRGNPKVIDKDQLDKDLADVIKRAAATLYSADPPSRIKKYTIINTLTKGERNLYVAHKKNLKLCDVLLAELEETIEHYQVRAFPKIVKHLLTYGYRNVTLESAISRGRKLYENCSEEMKVKLNDILVNMGMKV